MTGVIATIPKFQFSSATGAPLANGTLTTYLAGTTTLAVTYQDQALVTANTNPIILDSRGECVLWFDSAKTYKLVLKNSAGVIQWTQDNLTNTEALVTALTAALAAPSGSSLVGYMPAGTGAVSTTVQAKLRESVSVKDFGAVGDGVTDDTAAIQAAINAASEVRFIAGSTYIVSPQALSTLESGVGICLNLKSNLRLVMYGATIRQKAGTSGSGSIIGNVSAITNCIVEGGTVDGNRSNTTGNMCTVVMWNALDCRIKNVSAINNRFLGLGFRSTSTGYGQNAIINSSVSGSNYIGIQCSRQDIGVSISGNTVNGTSDNGIDIEGNNIAGGSGYGARNSIINNTIYSSSTGIFLESVGECIVSGNTIQNFSAFGIVLNQINTPAVEVLITGNRIKDGSGKYGINIANNSGKVLISSNTFQNLKGSIVFNLGKFVTVGLNTHESIEDQLVYITAITNTAVQSWISTQTYIGVKASGVPFTASPITNSNNVPSRAFAVSIMPTAYLNDASMAASSAAEYIRTTGTLATNGTWGAYALYYGGVTLISNTGGMAIANGDYILINGTLFYVKQFTGGGWQIQNLAFVDGNYTSTVNGPYSWIDYYPQWQTT